MSLEVYARKRDFKKTAEPPATPAPARRARAKPAAPRFVVQKHAATRLHFDLRLELDGALKSWAVPKGMPLKHGEKRLAVHVEDHPVSYIDFEGTIPKGEYGGGTVMVWDTGTYIADTASPAEDLAKGKLHFTLHGKKLRGAWHLVRLRSTEENQWLVIRGGEDLEPISARRDDASATSGRSMKAISAGGAAPAAKTKKTKPAVAPSLAFVEPMMARLVTEPPPGEWGYEIKFDGYRALAVKDASGVRLFSRNQKNLGDKFPEVVEALAALATRAAILDGELVALDPTGRSSFQLLQAAEIGEERPPLYYYVFDLLHLDGKNLLDLPLTERKARLEKLLKPQGAGLIRFSATLGTDAEALLQHARRAGLEGLIGKQLDSRYEIGRRGGAWIKLKLHQEQEFIIGGYTPPAGSRSHFGALLVGVREGRDLVFVGKVGTGFDQKLLGDLHARFAPMLQDACPFANLPVKRSARYGEAMTAAVMKRCHWVRPVLVCQLRFAEWTRDNRLRQPVFLGLREDKKASAVVRERAA